MMKKRFLAAILCATLFCSAVIHASASHVIQRDGLVYVPDHSIFFVDVDTNYNWALQAVDYLANAKIISGREPYFFAPGESLTRAEFITMLSRAYRMDAYVTEDNFSDVPADEYYTDAMSAAKNLGILTGDGQNQCHPLSPLTRQDAMVILMRTLEKTGLQFTPGTLEQYTDADSIQPYAAQAVGALCQANIISGTDGALRPTETITRAEVAVLLYRALMLEPNLDNQPVYISRSNVVNLCIGASFYPNVTIQNAQPEDILSGLYHCTEIRGEGEEFTAILSEPQPMNQQIRWENGILYVDGVAVDVAEEVECICIDPYSLLSNEPVCTGDEYEHAAVSMIEGVVTQIYYAK